jgi:hypothetical protein
MQATENKPEGKPNIWPYIIVAVITAIILWFIFSKAVRDPDISGVKNVPEERIHIQDTPVYGGQADTVRQDSPGTNDTN